MATKRTVSVIILQGENSSDETNVQSVLENAASALHQASKQLTREASGHQQSNFTSCSLGSSLPGTSFVPSVATNQLRPQKRTSEVEASIAVNKRAKTVTATTNTTDTNLPLDPTNDESTSGNQNMMLPKRLLKELRVVDLKSELGNQGLSTVGLKAVLTDRLRKYLEDNGCNVDTYDFSQKYIIDDSNKVAGSNKTVPIKELTNTQPTTKVANMTEKPSTSKADTLEKSQSIDPCPVCFDTPLYPLRLPCDHAYCFLCAKGLIESNSFGGGGICAMCRRPFPRDIFKNSKHHGVTETNQKFCWFYEGKNGWWKFDERNNEAIEEAFATGVEKFQLLLCGNLYAIDFKNKIQYRVDGTGRMRNIKRDNSSSNSKGIAGLHT